MKLHFASWAEHCCWTFETFHNVKWKQIPDIFSLISFSDKWKKHWSPVPWNYWECSENVCFRVWTQPTQHKRLQIQSKVFKPFFIPVSSRISASAQLQKLYFFFLILLLLISSPQLNWIINFHVWKRKHSKLVENINQVKAKAFLKSSTYTKFGEKINFA